MTTPNRTPGNRLTFDPTINAGHLLTFAGFLVTGFLAYATLDKRITVVEQRAAGIELRVIEQEVRTNIKLNEIKRDVKDTNTILNQLVRELLKDNSS